MKSVYALRLVAEIASGQWGLVTAGQLAPLGVTRMNLSRLTESGHLIRLAHGVYLDAAAPEDEFTDLKAAWLATDPKVTAAERLRRDVDVTVAGASAAQLHGVGDLLPARHDFVAPKRRQSQRHDVRFRQRELSADMVTVVNGLPVMRLEPLIADLVDDIGDLSLVADALRDAASRTRLDQDQLANHLAPLAARHGLPRNDGWALLDKLFETAQIDAVSTARQAATRTTDPSIAWAYLNALPQDALVEVAARMATAPAFGDRTKNATAALPLDRRTTEPVTPGPVGES